jgi:hypothetical protein
MSKECPPDKILNTITNRCVSKTSKKGKEILKKMSNKKNKTLESKIHVKDPIDSKYREICDKGLISDNVNPLLYILSKKMGEFHDVYCVANNNKTLASLDYSSYGKKKLRKNYDIKLINNVINYANSNNVQYLHNKKTGGMYLKSIFFLPENYEHALKLMYILWYPDPNFPGIEQNIAIGLLLDYDENNIILFNKKNFSVNTTKKDVKLVVTKLQKLKVTLEMLQKDYKIVHKTVIENL